MPDIKARDAAKRGFGKSLSKPRLAPGNLVAFRMDGLGMTTTARHLDRERRTIAKMVDIYCTDHHDTRRDTLCEECREFFDYAEVRLQKCPYGENKPTCANCPIHCYKPTQRAHVKKIMRYAGPRMLLHHPLLTIAHKIDGFRMARHPRELTREQRLKARE